ncbi:thiamine-phosphate kinase [Bermanella marisrubri]|uniref:Thiamine-monophosphate kinase n=1 Tax=Bermanella marisrubri TaxID=207949 RepID=Q1N2P0_9GAMM|nr:thiamine-phosphate kinase [Bermanella marisrubri]EAT12367.1 thiamine monophosphate kinase [Oceanobacter sp. RED65] [Bermanella marisrubri]QIZ85450.1 thiamine-phosphate kinase [Bermanella marisrubri]
MNEFDMIKQYFQDPQLHFPHPNVRFGIGDDCASILPDENHELVFSMDTLVDGVHFLQTSNSFDIGTRALCVTLSDLAAMAATPIGFTLALTIPEAHSTWLQGFSQGLAEIAQRFHCPIVGGDTTRGPHCVITIQVHGQVKKGKALMRSGAKPGDKVFVSGDLGDGAGALSQVLENPLDSTGLAQRYFQPLPEIEFAQAIQSYATSGMDISDGLLQDLEHICRASQVGMMIDPESIPMSADLIDKVGYQRAMKFALTGGDDYRLVYTAPDCAHGIQIGEVVAEPKSVNVSGLDADDLLSTGYQHFR